MIDYRDDGIRDESPFKFAEDVSSHWPIHVIGCTQRVASIPLGCISLIERFVDTN